MLGSFVYSFLGSLTRWLALLRERRRVEGCCRVEGEAVVVAWVARRRRLLHALTTSAMAACLGLPAHRVVLTASAATTNL